MPEPPMKLPAFLALSVAFLLSGPAHAQYLSTLATSPISRFNDTDNKLFMATIDQALKEGVDGTAIPWKNDKSPAAGSVTPQRSHESQGMPCRDLLIVNSYRTLKAEGVHTFCRDRTGKWKLAQ
jgi:surface antigen